MAMAVRKFTLSGREYAGDVADAMYQLARDHGFDDVCGGFQPWPPTIPSGHRHDPFYAWCRVSGMAASVEMAFDTAAELVDFLRYVPLTEPNEPSATEAYRKLLAIEGAPHA